MSQNADDLLLIEASAAALALVANFLLRRWWLASPIAAAVSGIVSTICMVAENGWRVRPSDIAFWLPLMVVQAGFLALPLTCAIGLVFHFVRKKGVHFR
jgi:hypothetical protein